VGFEFTIPAFERVKAVHALDYSATVTGHVTFLLSINFPTASNTNMGDVRNFVMVATAAPYGNSYVASV
jgi:hypothetical protein